MQFRKNQSVSFKQAAGVYYITGWEDGIDVTTRLKSHVGSVRKERVYFIKDVMEKKDVVYQAFSSELTPLHHTRTRSGYVALPAKKLINRALRRRSHAVHFQSSSATEAPLSATASSASIASQPQAFTSPQASPKPIPPSDLGIFLNFLSCLH